MTEEKLPEGEIIGVVIGAIVLFFLISMVPIVIMWYHRRRTAARVMREAHNMSSPMEQASSVERWLEQQNAPSDVNQYSQDTCPICLSSLSSSPYLVCPEPARLPRHQHNLSPTRSDSCQCGNTDLRRDSGILVLNKCHHAFHLTCLTSWFEYQRYRCPICQASYSPADAVRR